MISSFKIFLFEGMWIVGILFVMVLVPMFAQGSMELQTRDGR